MFDGLLSVLNRQYLKVRQQYRHLQACVAYLSRERLPTPRFILFGRGRSGTTALTSLLDSHSALRCEGEILHNYVPFPYAHVLGRCARAQPLGYGCKILSYQLRDIQSSLESPETLIRGLHEEYEFDILYLRRSNLLRHALSNIRARREGFHEKKSDAAQTRSAIRVDPAHVIEWMESSEALCSYEQRVLRDVPYLSLTYEEHIRDPSSHQKTVDTICDYLNLESEPVETSYRKIAPRTLTEGVANYEELAHRLGTTRFAEYLDE